MSKSLCLLILEDAWSVVITYLSELLHILCRLWMMETNWRLKENTLIRFLPHRNNWRWSNHQRLSCVVIRKVWQYQPLKFHFWVKLVHQPNKEVDARWFFRDHPCLKRSLLRIYWKTNLIITLPKRFKLFPSLDWLCLLKHWVALRFHFFFL